MDRTQSAISKLVFAVMLAGSSIPVMAAPMSFGGSTSGSFTDSTTASVLGFTGTSFSGTTSSGTAQLTDLGTFAVSVASTSSVSATGDFDLTITFLIPVGANPVNPVVAAVSGTINTQVANNVLINFGAGQTVNYSNAGGSGSFFLTINDVTFPNASRDGATQTLTGSITSAIFNPATNPPASTIPEPATLALIGLALTGFAVSRRRRA